MAEPHPALARAADSVLVVIDCQERLWKVMHDGGALQARLTTLLRAAEVLGIPVIFTEQNPQGLGPTLPALRALAPRAQVIAKQSFSCCGAAEFVEALRDSGRGTVLLCGVETHICVLQTALDALARGWKVQIVQDACGSRDPANRSAGLARMDRAGAVLTLIESALFEWMGGTDCAAFRQVRDLLK